MRETGGKHDHGSFIQKLTLSHPWYWGVFYLTTYYDKTKEKPQTIKQLQGFFFETMIASICGGGRYEGSETV